MTPFGAAIFGAALCIAAALLLRTSLTRHHQGRSWDAAWLLVTGVVIGFGGWLALTIGLYYLVSNRSG
jgi:hypothetical protein